MKHVEDLKRLVFLIILALLVWIILIFRIIQIQVIDRGKYVEKANDQYIYLKKLSSNRGKIYDRNFEYLAINKPVFSLGIDPSKVTDHQFAAAQCAEVLGGNKSYYLRQLTNGGSFIWLKRGVQENIVNKLETQKISGLRVIREMRRFYPKNKLASNLVGFTNLDMVGTSGVELTMNNSLNGNPGLAYYQKDAFGKTLKNLSYPIQKPETGKDIVLTIDNSFQLSAEEELHRTVTQYKANGGIVIITNPMTGEILAMAVTPTFNPNNAGNYPPEFWRNRAITDCFEPGSTFKPFFMSAILEEEIKQPDDVIFCENGKYKIFDREIVDIHGYGKLTLRKIIAKSSNIGMAKLAETIDKDLIYQYIRNFGFGVKTGIELSGEVSGNLRNTVEWSKYTPIVMAMGYEVSVTALQMAMAYGAIANGGKLLKPRIYIDNFDLRKKKIKKPEPKIIRNVISQKTSQILVSMLEDVVQNGTGKRAAIPGLRIAGKTGTAKKYDIKRKSYSSKEFIASFVGFFPADAPKILIYVTIDNPKEEYWGGVVAATTFKRISQRILRIMEIDSKNFFRTIPQDENKESDEKIITPDLIYKKKEVAIKIVEDLGLKFEYQQDGELIVEQYPEPGTRVHPNTIVTLTLSKMKKNNHNYTRVPKVIGYTIREALNRFSLENLHVVVQGSGRVVKQIPKAGEKIRVGARCVIECEPSIDLSNFTSW